MTVAFDSQPIKAFNTEQQSSLSLLYHNLELENIPASSISFAEDLLAKGQKINLSEKQMFWVERLSKVKPAIRSELDNKIDKLELSIKRMVKTEGYVNPNTLIFAEDLIKKGRKYGRLSEKQIYWIEELTTQGITRPAAIFCSICNRKGHSSYSCWRRDGRVSINSKLPKTDMSLSLSEDEEKEFSEIPDGRYNKGDYENDKEIDSVKEYIGNWRKDNMPDVF